MARGWTTNLFPYLDDPPNRRRNHALNVGSAIGCFTIRSKPLVKYGVGLHSFPCGLSRAPVVVQYPDDSKRESNLAGGFFGVGQRQEDNALCPVTSWDMVDRDQENKRGRQLRRVRDSSRGAAVRGSKMGDHGERLVYSWGFSQKHPHSK